MFSRACSIQLKDFVLVTGGFQTKTKVSIYGVDGWINDLPELKIGRFDHGCGYYLHKEEIVSTKKL